MSLATRWPVVLDLTAEQLAAIGASKIKAVNIPLMADQSRLMDAEIGYFFDNFQRQTFKTAKCAASAL